VSFAIREEGSVSAVAVSDSTLGDRAVERCIARVIDGVLFPSVEHGGEYHVEYPFTFAPRATWRAPLAWR
jgi:hypothetical protein